MNKAARARHRALNAKLRGNMDELIAALKANDPARARKIRARVTPEMLGEAFMLDAEHDLSAVERAVAAGEDLETAARRIMNAP